MKTTQRNIIAISITALILITCTAYHFSKINNNSINHSESASEAQTNLNTEKQEIQEIQKEQPIDNEKSVSTSESEVQVGNTNTNVNESTGASEGTAIYEDISDRIMKEMASTPNNDEINKNKEIENDLNVDIIIQSPKEKFIVPK